MRFIASVLITSLTIAIPSMRSYADDPSEVKEETDSAESLTSVWMEKKMDYTQGILRGLATADFEQMSENARQMRLLSKVEGFVRGGKAGYRDHLQMFERVCDEMIRQSDNENLPGVTLAFNQLTVSCVSCHQSLRPPLTEESGKSPAPITGEPTDE